MKETGCHAPRRSPAAHAVTSPTRSPKPGKVRRTRCPTMRAASPVRYAETAASTSASSKSSSLMSSRSSEIRHSAAAPHPRPSLRTPPRRPSPARTARRGAARRGAARRGAGGTGLAAVVGEV